LGRGLNLEGGDADGVVKTIEFLISMNRGFNVDVGERVLVVGGGDVAMDAARTALRTSDYESKETDRPTMTDALDVARSAARAGARQIQVMSLEARSEMPAHDFEIEEAEHEGITFISRRGPRRIVVSDGMVAGLETVGVSSVFDEEGRFSPVFDEEDLQIFDVDTVILAIGQAIDLDALDPEAPTISPHRTIQVDDDTGATSLDGV
jgi:NADPH-dependent glutamate synthase beta subunit-like oxidoreductase